MRCLLLVLLILQIPASAETRAGKWFRRGATSALCATSAVDAIQTLSLAGRRGIYESNGLFRSGHGVNAPVLVGVKALVCAGSLVMGEHLPANHRTTFSSLNLVGAGVNTFAIVHNRQVARTAEGTKP